MATQRSLYEVLNVSPAAEPVVIEAAYRALMKKYHPDQGSGALGDATAAEINRAFAILRDAQRRADYDRGQWVREQEIMLAQYAPAAPLPPHRRATVFGWSGWVVAVILGGIIFMMAERASGLAAARADAERAAALSEPDLRSQPNLPDEPLISPADAAEIRAAALAVKPPPADPEPEVAVAEPVPVPLPEIASVERIQPARPAASRPKPRRQQPRQARARKAPEADFLEREGYIY
jgi:curved DNA-binding protein CbpA